MADEARLISEADGRCDLSAGHAAEQQVPRPG
jgi:hypothetical protein